MQVEETTNPVTVAGCPALVDQLLNVVNNIIGEDRLRTSKAKETTGC